MRKLNKAFPWFVLLGLVIPFGLGFVLDGTLAGALAGGLWAASCGSSSSTT